MERLLHISEQPPPFALGNIRRRHAFNQHAPFLRLVQPHQKLEDRAFARARASGERYLLARMHRKTQMAQHRMIVVSEGHVAQLHLRRALLARRGQGVSFRHLRLFEKFVNSPHARDGRLNRLDFHAQAFHRRKDLADIIHHGHGRARRHPEQRQHARFARGRQ